MLHQARRGGERGVRAMLEKGTTMIHKQTQRENTKKKKKKEKRRKEGEKKHRQETTRGE